MLRGVIFDIDGTLVDSNDAHARSWVDTFVEAGYAVPFEVVRPLIGMGGDKLLPKTIGVRHDSREGKALTKRRSEIFREKYLPALEPLEGSRSLVERVRPWPEAGRRDIGQGRRAGRASESGWRRWPDGGEGDRFRREAIQARPGHRRSGDRTVGPRADELVMIGDTPYDVEAATRAGVRIIGFRSGGWDDEDLSGAVEIPDGPAHLLANYSGSLLGKKS